ncbi:bacteriophage abortive infection AbiH family protein [Faecalibacillus intestinalis]|uniref:bacteriophage abortive infection AbiH family protein n=1 Tax=Faecalibacillus intestinalis TaxID=1982626 RepID=UPI0022E893FA|nr:bacteriophage abortive infection AbiH family protein [Faecalibacillus intestinalis]
MGKKILLIGNGFDLAHGLPTSYKDFLDFCKMVRELYTYPIIDNEYNQKKLIDWNTDKTIKSKLLECYENRKNCFEDKITTQCKELDELYDCIKENVWINYFLEREKSIGENWIDFESEISNVVQAIETLKGYIERDEDVLKIKDTKQQTIIYFLKIAKKSLQDVFNLKRIDGFIEDISIELDKLIRSLEIYICEFVNEIDIIKENDDIKTITPDYVLSFNYSNTYERIYGQSKEVTYDYIHGKADIENNVDTCNLVLGIDEYLEDDKNDKLEFIAFKKFYQRIYKSTDSTYMKWVEQIKKYPEVNHNLFIFGHSLDKTDRDILKLLICNDNVTTKIYYYRKNKNDKKELGKLIKNLVRIMGQDELISRTMGEHKTIEFIPQTVFVAKNN